MQRFRDRRDAGRRLAARLSHLRSHHPIVLGLPRGGVPVAAEVARVLESPLDVIVVRKLGMPFQRELGMGAVGEGGIRVLNDDMVLLARITPRELESVEARERAEVARRARRFRGQRQMLNLEGRTVIVVDDGIATGGTVRAALQVARAHRARRVILAVPVAPPEALTEFAGLADEFVCLATPTPFFGVGQWYDDFSQTSDEEVAALLAENAARPAISSDASVGSDGEVEIDVGDAVLSGHLTVPVGATGVVVFAHGSGSSRHSPRNQLVARVLNDAGLGTLLFDLLTKREELDRGNVFDIGLLAGRLGRVTRWLAAQPAVAGLPVGYFGASTGAAAALGAASAPDSDVRAVVSRGGRADLAGPKLSQVRAPTLLIVGSRDDVVLELSRDAARRLSCEHHVAVIPGATHLFEEPGTLEQVAGLAREWFTRHLGAAAPPARASRRAS